jgi:aerobic carbon-monoxide dehydrogenase medium subunit
MYPSRFRYEAPRSLDEAISMLQTGGDYCKVLAGGQSLVPLMKLRFASPELVVDINNVPGLAYHRVDPDGTLRIGALCRHADLEHSDLLKTTQPTMAGAAPLIADPIVRNRGTLVGSLCKGTGPPWCWRSAARWWREDRAAPASSRSPTSSPGLSRPSWTPTRSRWKR